MMPGESKTTRGVSRASTGVASVGSWGSGRRQAFGVVVPTRVTRGWKRASGKERVIHQAELLPAVTAMNTWKGILAHSRVLLFFDNDAARQALVAGSTSSAASAAIVNKFWELVEECSASVWVDRVSTKSNPSDGPSRGDWTWCIAHGFRRVEATALGA